MPGQGAAPSVPRRQGLSRIWQRERSPEPRPAGRQSGHREPHDRRSDGRPDHRVSRRKADSRDRDILGDQRRWPHLDVPPARRQVVRRGSRDRRRLRILVSSHPRSEDRVDLCLPRHHPEERSGGERRQGAPQRRRRPSARPSHPGADPRASRPVHASAADAPELLSSAAPRGGKAGRRVGEAGILCLRRRLSPQRLAARRPGSTGQEPELL